MKKKILVIAAHPDDETLGCGGTVAKLTKTQEYDANVVFFTDGVGARSIKNKKKELERKMQCKKACKLLGFNQTKFYNFPDNSLDTIPLIKIVKLIEKEILEVKPNIIFTHHDGDLNIDHNLISRATVTATRNYDKKVYKIFTFEVLSSTGLNFGKNNNNFLPNTFFDITETIKYKIQALKIYKDEIRKFPHPRSDKGLNYLAKYRGMFVGLAYAEAFRLIKSVQ